MFQKGLDALSRYIADAGVQSKMDSKSDSKSKQLSWTLLLGWVHDAIVANVSRLQTHDHPNKAKGG